MTVSDDPVEDDFGGTSFKEALLALDYKANPVFAVLDGAQFDNLPQSLFDGDFVSRSLYLDRGDNDSEQIITAPHMVTLDERSEKEIARSYEETVEALLDLINDKPAAVFWQCPEGGDALYKNLRSINMVVLPKIALPSDEQEFVKNDHAPALFRHADANVLMQTLFSMTTNEAARFFGPARRVIFAPNEIWRRDANYAIVDWSETWPSPHSGMLKLSVSTMQRIEKKREDGLRKWSVVYFTDPEAEGFDASYTEQIERAFVRARYYGLEQKEDIWDFIRMDLKHGDNFEVKPGYEGVFEALTENGSSPSRRIFYASQACEEKHVRD